MSKLKKIYFALTMAFIGAVGMRSLVPFPPYELSDYVRIGLSARPARVGGMHESGKIDRRAPEPTDWIESGVGSSSKEISAHSESARTSPPSIEHSVATDPDGTTVITTVVNDEVRERIERAFPAVVADIVFSKVGKPFVVPGLSEPLGLKLEHADSSLEPATEEFLRITGLQDGDVLIALNGYRIGAADGIFDAFPTLAGKRSELGILRDGDALRLVIGSLGAGDDSVLAD